MKYLLLMIPILAPVGCGKEPYYTELETKSTSIQGVKENLSKSEESNAS